LRSRSKNAVSAIILAAGASRRFGGIRARRSKKKQFFMVNGSPLFLHTACALARMQEIAEIIIVLPSYAIARYRLLIERRVGRKLKAVVAGGVSRAESVANGLRFVSDEPAFVLTQDGVRPFITPEYVRDCLKQLKTSDGAVVGIPVRDTLKLTNKFGKVMHTLPRSNLYQAQTPQMFKKKILKKAYAVKRIDDATDDAMLVERIGGRIAMVEGSPDNIKLTVKADIALYKYLSKKYYCCKEQLCIESE
jgi:2-C-methyl-D-erythritol 4-phosphate cytidylyltransferase